MTILLAALRGARNRVLQIIALYAPGGSSLRVTLHRWRGATIGPDSFIGTGVLIETARPERVQIGRGVTLSIRAVVIAHFRASTKADTTDSLERYSVRIEDEAFVGPGVIVLPNVTIGRGAVVTAGSVVTQSVRALTMVQGNPARPVARCGIPLGRRTDLRDFYRRLEPIDAGVRERIASEAGRR